MSSNKIIRTPTRIHIDTLVNKLIERMPIGHALDVGVGTAEFALDLYQRGFIVHGIDNQQAAVDISKERCAGINSITIEKVDLFDFSQVESFNFVVAREVLEHIDDDTEALRLFHKWAKRNGNLLLTTPAQPYLYGHCDKVSKHFRRYSKKELTDKLTIAGFNIDCFWSVGFPFSNFTTFLHQLISYRGQTTVNHEIGIEKTGGKFIRISNLIPWPLIWPISDLFLNTGFGSHFIVTAVKRP